ncbi:MAG: hypothetical protein SH857_12290 [Chitinophagales bacterium]|nr:hypothetical protein [Chitinophagales bacterium]
MIKKINWSALRDGKSRIEFLDDIFMVQLVLLNLAFLVFDWHFGLAFFRNLLASVAPAFHDWYAAHIHPNFLLIDAVFVAIFITEFCIRWLVAIVRKEHGKWYFFPFVHWYDILGCIPLGAFRWLRILRLVSMTIRLHKMGVIDIKNIRVYKEVMEFIRIITEEISDRVVVHVLKGVQREIKNDSPLTNRMLTEIIKPHQDTLTEWLSHRIRRVTEYNYNLYKEDIQTYVEAIIKEAVKQNQEVKNLAMIPVVGGQIRKALESSVSDITFNVVNGMVRDLASDRNNKFIDELTDIVFESILLQEENQELNRVTKEVFLRAIELVKEQVELKQWQLEARAEKTE